MSALPEGSGFVLVLVIQLVAMSFSLVFTLISNRINMPFIPLWQLDTHLAIHKDLTLLNLDPLRVFTHVEKWRLNKN
jgi:hypothetical protein